MPTVILPRWETNGERFKPRFKPKTDDDEARKIRNRFYNSKAYRNVRAIHISKHPICQVCELKGLTVAGSQVHHWYSPFQTTDEKEKYRLGLMPENLVTLCSHCHSSLHQGELQGCFSLSDVKQRLEYLKRINEKYEI